MGSWYPPINTKRLPPLELRPYPQHSAISLETANMVRIANLPLEVRQIFVQVLAKEISLLDFEQWFYGKMELEEILPQKTYFSLLELDYHNKSSFYDLEKLLKEFLDPGSVEAYEMKKLIERLDAEGPDWTSPDLVDTG